MDTQLVAGSRIKITPEEGLFPRYKVYAVIEKILADNGGVYFIKLEVPDPSLNPAHAIALTNRAPESNTLASMNVHLFPRECAPSIFDDKTIYGWVTIFPA
jgi:hypothetical protein